MGGEASFFGGLLEGVNRRRGEVREEDLRRENEDRQGLLHIIETAARSPDLDPSAYPKLVEMAMQAHGAKGKELSQVKTAFQTLLGQGYDTTGTKITGYDTTPVTDNAGADAPYVSDPGDAPVAEFGARIRKPLFQSPAEAARREAYAFGEKERAIRAAREPFEAADDARALERERVKAEGRRVQAEARAKAQSDLLVQRYGLMAGKDLEARTQAKWAAMRAVDPGVPYEEARAAAAQELNSEYGLKSEALKAKIGFTKAATEAIPQRLELERQRVEIAREGNDIRWNELDLKSQTLALEEAYKSAMVELKGNSTRQQKYAAEATPVMQQIRQVEAQRASLERMIVGGFDTTGTAANQVQAYASQLSDLRKRLNDITSKFTSGQADVKMNVERPAARGRGSRYVPQKVDQKKLEDLLK